MCLRKTFSENVKLFRKKKKYTQAQLAEICDIATNYMGEIENQKKFPSIEVIEKIAAALDIRPYVLFFDTKDINAKDIKNIAVKWNQNEKDEISNEIFLAVQRILNKH